MNIVRPHHPASHPVTQNGSDHAVAASAGRSSANERIARVEHEGTGPVEISHRNGNGGDPMSTDNLTAEQRLQRIEEATEENRRRIEALERRLGDLVRRRQGGGSR